VLANGGGSIDQAEGSLFWRIGLEMDWNVLQGGANIAEMNQAKLQHASLSWQRDNMATSLEENIRSTAASAIAFFKIIGVTSLGVQTAQRNYALVNEAYLDGETTLIELIDAQQQLLSASISVRQALYEFLSKLLTLEQSIAYYPFFEDDADARIRELEAILQR
jgi:outer membrane protein TolC